MSLQRYFRLVSTTEVLNKGLDESVIEANNKCRKIYGSRVLNYCLMIISTNMQVYNKIGVHLRYLGIM